MATAAHIPIEDLGGIRAMGEARAADGHLRIGAVALPRGKTTAVEEAVVHSRPFADLVRLQKAIGRGGPPVLIVSPLSGQRPLLMRDLALGLLPVADVHFVAWADAAEVPVAAGRFGLDENIAYLMEFIRELGPGTHVLGVSQSALPALAATALLAEADGGGAEPASLTLISGFLDPRINPNRVGLALSVLPRWWFEALSARPVPPGRPGHGRIVYPASVQRRRLLAYLHRHLAGFGELWSKLAEDDGDLGAPRFIDMYLTLQDLPWEAVVEMMTAAFHDHALPSGVLSWRGQPVRPEAVSRCGLMTIEALRDDISGIGQTSIAHRLCRNVPAGRRGHHIEPTSGHFGTIHGALWRRSVLPRLWSFMQSCERRPPAASKGARYELRPSGPASRLPLPPTT